MPQEDAWHIIQSTDSVQRTTTYGNRSISSSDIRNFFCQPSSVASYHGSAMSAVMIRCQRSYILHRTVDGSRRWGISRKSCMSRTKKWTGQPLWPLLRVADVDEQPSQRMRLSEYRNDAWVSLELVVKYNQERLKIIRGTKRHHISLGPTFG